MAHLRLSEAARADIRAIYREGVERFGLAQADAYTSVLREAIKRLAAYPESAPFRKGLGGPVRVLPVRSHIVIYAIDAGGVHILRIRHTREDWIASAP